MKIISIIIQVNLYHQTIEFIFFKGPARQGHTRAPMRGKEITARRLLPVSQDRDEGKGKLAKIYLLN